MFGYFPSIIPIEPTFTRVASNESSTTKREFMYVNRTSSLLYSFALELDAINNRLLFLFHESKALN